MKILPAYNVAEIAERYYKKLGKFTTREQAAKNFHLLKKPDRNLVSWIIDEIYHEQKREL